MTAVTDTSVVLNLCLLGQEGLLAALFTEVIAPPPVVEECELLAATDERFRDLAFPSQIRRVGSTSIIKNLPNPARLHSGEIAVISVAVEIGADVVLMDERAGRSAANTLGLKTLGLLGILIAPGAEIWSPPWHRCWTACTMKRVFGLPRPSERLSLMKLASLLLHDVWIGGQPRQSSIFFLGSPTGVVNFQVRGPTSWYSRCIPGPAPDEDSGLGPWLGRLSG